MTSQRNLDGASRTLDTLPGTATALAFVLAASGALLVGCGPAGAKSSGDAGSDASSEGGSGTTDGQAGADGGSSSDAGGDSGGDAGDGAPKVACPGEASGGSTSCSATAFLFESPNPSSVPGGVASGIAVGDVNGDCKDDIVVGATSQMATPSGDSGISILLSNGDGTFKPAVAYAFMPFGTDGTSDSPALIALADLDGDGHADVIGYPYLGYILNKGDGTFGTMEPVPTNSSLIGSFMATADMNGDGTVDIVLAGTNQSADMTGFQFVVLRNSGGNNPAFSESDFQVTPDNGHSLDGLAVADFDGDGKPDVATADVQGAQILVSINNGDGTFKTPVPYPVGAGPLTAADVDGDGKADLIFILPTGGAESSVAVLINKGDGTFGMTPATYDVPGNSASQVLAADVNGDGKPDLVTIDYDNSEGALLMNIGGGKFGTSTNLPGATLYSPLQVAAGHFSGDATSGLAVSLLNTGYEVTAFSGRCP
jgi:FG-GAP-like repeat